MELTLVSLLLLGSDSHCESASVFRDLLREAQWRGAETERAAFLVRDPDGAIRTISWPVTMQRRSATYRGRIPPNAVAIAHTHPDGMPDPSRHDIGEAMRIGLPIYVISRTSVARVDPDGSTQHIVAHRHWTIEIDRHRPGLCGH